MFVLKTNNRNNKILNHNSLLRRLTNNKVFDHLHPIPASKFKDCKIPHLKFKIESGKNQENVTCRRVRPISDSCHIAEEIFHSEPPVECDQALRVDVCTVVFSQDRYTIQCKSDDCHGHLSFGVFSNTDGTIKWTTVANSSILQARLNGLLHGGHHHSFCIIKCLRAKSAREFIRNYASEVGDDIFLQYEDWFPEYFGQQLLVLPPSVSKRPVQKHEIQDTNINVNIIFIDSVSRHHFFRSMKKTLEVFSHINSNYNANGSTIVLDYELLQGIKSRTFENLETLFSGKINLHEKPFGTLEMPPHPLQTDILLNKFRYQGYRTLWLEDLCFMWEWGISKDLLVHNKKLDEKETWKDLQNALRNAGIDDIALTLANCKILSSNSVKDHFHGPDAVCYNGRHQHEYFLQYLTYFQQQSVQQNSPFLTFLETNVGHEDTGRRIQPFDPHFAKYLKSLIELPNVFTIIFSDHGNSYGTFLDNSLEGKIEMYHPFLFFIIPPLVQRHLGKKKMDSLISNQKKLISLLDLHYTLMDLSKSDNIPHSSLSKSNKNSLLVNKDGLFSDFPADRSCIQVPRLMPALCICEGFENTINYDPRYALLALFAIGQLNNKINGQYRADIHSELTKVRSCFNLVPSKVENLRVSFEKSDSVITKMDIHVTLLPGQRPEVFFVAVRSWTNLGVMELLSYERTTPYSHFSVCADKGVNLNLCVCSSNHRSKAKTSWYDIVRNPDTVSEEDVSPPLDTKMEVERLENSNDCLVMVTLKNKKGINVYVANTCQKGVFDVEIALKRKNMIISYQGKSAKFFVGPGEVMAALTAVRNNDKVEFSWELFINAH
ncbi:hypothetical protein FSP39_000523 [Pinctada imbricata]|uniref:Uncharacterized protein n=1 Tax=Pinctada imbricata TaxID=66713 RepID=A0AA88Y676_PINIB|nr:hypothetical protein FSP39_000523 [Pinctada imbricata]